MIKKVNEKQNMPLAAAKLPSVRIGDASFPAPFRSGLEYSSPARGTWNIVHTGMLVPQLHLVYVCAAGCLRGVVLTAAEMGAVDRFSSVVVRENDLLDGDMEDLIIDGVTDIINKLPKRPPAVMVHTSCIHHFTGTDIDMVYRELRSRFPDIDFADGYMNPIMRKSGLTPDQLMRTSIYKFLRPCEEDRGTVSIIGSDIPTQPDSDLMQMLRRGGLTVREITSCKTYEEYQRMAEAGVFISYYPDAAPGGDTLAERLSRKHFKLAFSFDYGEIDRTFAELAELLEQETGRSGLARTEEEIAQKRAECEAAAEETKALIGDTPVAIDYTFCPRPLGLAMLLLDHGFNVKKVYLDGVSGGDKATFEYLQKVFPDLELCPTVHVDMRFANTANSADPAPEADAENKGTSACGMLAIGQKAAYFENTNHFINVVEGGGMNGYEAVTRTFDLMQDAYREEKDMRGLVQIKGLGCEVCVR
ncbi:MAG: nitrogenase [Mogibacterium sp.]|nr:nitrogenase [Mogibacterium sp.]